MLAVLPAVLDRLAARWLLWIESDRLLPPWHVPQDVFEAYIEDDPDDEDAPDRSGEGEPDVEDELEEESEDESDLEEDEEEESVGEERDDEPADDDEPTPPWDDPPTGWFDRDDLVSWEYLHSSFAAAVTAFDADLGRVFDLLRSRGLDRSAVWAVTADRGFPLGEHGVIGTHRPWLHEELVHVPLIVRLPEAVGAGRRVSALTQPADLAQTLLAWLGVEDGEDKPRRSADAGHDLTPLMHGHVESVRPFAVSVLELGPAAEWAIRTPEWAFLLPVRADPDDNPRPPRLFEKPDDAWEVNDLRSRHPETAEELERLLREEIRTNH